MIQTEVAIWKGSEKIGKGYLTTEGSFLNQTLFSFSSRFESENGTNPDELIAAAQADSFSMKLSFVLNESGFTSDSLKTTAYVTYKNRKYYRSTVDP